MTTFKTFLVASFVLGGAYATPSAVVAATHASASARPLGIADGSGIQDFQVARGGQGGGQGAGHGGGDGAGHGGHGGDDGAGHDGNGGDDGPGHAALPSLNTFARGGTGDHGGHGEGAGHG